MKYLKWILFCAWWQTHKRYEFTFHTTDDNPFEIGITCPNNPNMVIRVTVEMLQRMKTEDVVLKRFLQQLEEVFRIRSYGFVEEVFESVRLEWQLPLYQAFLKEIE